MLLLLMINQIYWSFCEQDISGLEHLLLDVYQKRPIESYIMKDSVLAQFITEHFKALIYKWYD
jgi:hypothetical protein